MVAKLHKLTAGDGYTYLTRQVATGDTTELGRSGLADYYTAKGERPGVWMGAGLAGLSGVSSGDTVTEAHMRALFGEGRHPLADQLQRDAIRGGASVDEALKATALGRTFTVGPSKPNEFAVQLARRFAEFNKAKGEGRQAPIADADRSTIRTQLARETFVAVYGREPINERELSGHLARASRPAPKPVAGYDWSFTPPKSVSALWAVSARDLAEQIEAAHRAAVQDAFGWVEREVAQTRRGAGGVRQVPISGLIATAFTHRDSRAGDPNLHTHVAVSNKVQDASDGAWLALDGAVLYKAFVAASERYDTALERELSDRIGVSFELRKGLKPGSPQVREIKGVSGELCQEWSSRRADIEARKAELVAEFRATHGRTPTPKEGIALSQQATLETRQAKHEPRSEQQQREVWRQQAAAVLGSERAVDAMVSKIVMGRSRRTNILTDDQVLAMADGILDRIEASRARFQPVHIYAEAQRQIRAAELAPQVVEATLERVISAVTASDRVVPLDRLDPVSEPAALRRPDGSSMYLGKHQAMFTTTRILGAEERIVAASKQRDGMRLDPATVAIALLESEANGTRLNPGQAQLVQALATSGARVQLALAPAGSGKTTAMAVLTRAWELAGGSITGLAPTAVAASELRDSTNAYSDTLASLTFGLKTGIMPKWTREIGPGTLVMIDEAGMAGTLDLDAAISWITGRGASVRLIGDDQQLAAISAGGVLVDIRNEVEAVTLTELMRFSDTAEAAATLAVREGDKAALGFYTDRDRIKAVEDGELVDAVFNAWKADRGAGRASLMIAGTNSHVTALNDLARTDRLASSNDRVGREVQLRSGLRASRGDLIVTRDNNRLLRLSAHDYVKNGDRWTVTKVRRDGSLQAKHQRSGRLVTLPADYVDESIDLGYATTVHGAQGSTVDTCHVVITGAETRQLLYVAVSRGRHNNVMYVPVTGDGDPHNVIAPQTISPRTAVEVIESVLARDGAEQSARSYQRSAHDPATVLARNTGIYLDAVNLIAQVRLGSEQIAALKAAAEQLAPGVTEEPGWEALLGHLARLDAEGTRPHAVLEAAISMRSLDGAHDRAAVIDGRLDRLRPPTAGPLPWLPGVPAAIANDPTWGTYLAARVDQVQTTAAAVRARILATEPGNLPRWAQPLADSPDILGDVAVWRAVIGLPDSEPDPIGPPITIGRARDWQRALDERLTDLLGPTHAAGTRWADQIAAVDARVLQDPFWAVVGRRLDLAALARADVPQLVAQALTEGPLPDDHPAAALWWRLTPHLAPGASLTVGLGAARLRPEWTTALIETLPEGVGERVVRDPQWAALVATVDDTAARTGTDPQQIITWATSAIAGRIQDGAGGIRTSEVATVLTWRVADLAQLHQVDDHDDEPPPDDVDDYADDEINAFLNDWHRDQPAVHQTADSTESPSPADIPSAPAQPAEEVPAAADRAYPSYPDDYEMVDAASLPDPAQVQRIIELNTAAAEWYGQQYTGSPAAAYMASRFGTDLADDPRFTVGYAPTRGLAEHLAQHHGATKEELHEAGLMLRAEKDGRYFELFRDRVVVAIRNTEGQIVGFSGRAAPNAPATARKYVNTPNTAAFDKGSLLYGLAENQPALAAGAVPTRTEGVMDAIAVTLAGEGQAVGLAPLGTALTATQADLLATAGNDGTVLMATDTDAAGTTAAAKDFWRLAGIGADPHQVVLIDYTNPATRPKDPGELYQRDHASLTAALDPTTAPPMASALIAARIEADHARIRTEVWPQVLAARDCAKIIAATPEDQWPTHVSLTAQLLGHTDSYQLVADELADATNNWAASRAGLPALTPADRLAQARERLRFRAQGRDPEAARARLAAQQTTPPPPAKVDTHDAPRRQQEPPAPRIS